MVNAEDPLELAEAFAHRTPLELEVVSLAARMVREVNEGLRDAASAERTVKRVRRLEDAKAALAFVMALRDRWPFIGLNRLSEVRTDLVRLEQMYRAAGHYTLADLVPPHPDDAVGIAEMLSPLLHISGATPAPTRPGDPDALHH